MSNRKFTETKDYTFNAFSHAFKFIVPPFQRAYAWKNKDIAELWESMINNDDEYFIGNIVCLDANEESENRLVVIDGQQRLFTISLFLVAIRDEYAEYKDRVKKKYGDLLEGTIRDINNILFYKDPFSFDSKRELRLKPGKENLIEIYEQLVKSEIDINNKERIQDLDQNQKKYVDNYITIRKLVHDYVKEKEQFNALHDLAKKTTSLLFIVIVCKTDSDAYKIFEGLNSTGIGLTVADLVKNAVMMKVRKSADARSFIEEKWTELESIFEKENIPLFPKFLRHQWISQEGYITASKLFDSIKKHKLKNSSSDEVKTYVKELLSDAQTYIAFRFEGYEKNLHRKLDKNSKELIKRFRLLDLDQIYELLLALYNRFIRDSNYSLRNFNQDLHDFWLFSFRSKIMSINPSEYERIFADLCSSLSNKDDNVKVISDKYKKKLFTLVKNDDVFIEHFAMDLDYSSRDKKLIAYILDRVLKWHNRNIQVADPTIEHILPKSPVKWGLTKDDIKDYVHNIGNLTLLYKGDNRELQNAIMDKKIEKVFSKSKFKLNKRLKDKKEIFKTNPKKAIGERALELASIAAKVWSIK